MRESISKLPIIHNPAEFVGQTGEGVACQRVFHGQLCTMHGDLLANRGGRIGHRKSHVYKFNITMKKRATVIV